MILDAGGILTLWLWFTRKRVRRRLDVVPGHRHFGGVNVGPCWSEEPGTSSIDFDADFSSRKHTS
jgi:hypothetical protein